MDVNKRLTDSRSFVLTLGLLTSITALTIDISLPAIPAMVKALATDISRGQQIVGVFMLGIALSQVPAGLLSDRMGRMPVLYIGTGIFAIGSIVAAVVNNIDLLLAARFVQGLGASSSIVVGRAIVRDIARGREAARLMSLMTMIFTAAPVIAPSIGAFLIAWWGWHAPFVAIAVFSLLTLLAIRSNLVETHTPNKDGHPVTQLKNSFVEFFSHRQSIFALILLILPYAGLLSIIATSSALAVETYGYSVQAYGLIFALAGVSVLLGSALNRYLVMRFELMALVRLGVILSGLSGSQMLVIAWLDTAPFWWLWSCVCLFMFTIAILLTNVTVLALDPLPRIAGVASSIIGTTQNIVGAISAMLAAVIYDGSVQNAVIITGVSGTLIVFVYLLLPVIVPDGIVHHPDELARE